MIKWVTEQSVGLGRVWWLGLFEEKTSSECLSNLYNQDACNQFCYAAGITGYGAFLITPCQNQCMIEMCGQGILPRCQFPPTGWPCNPFATQKEMQKAGALMSPCFKNCMDAYTQSEFGTDEDQLKVAVGDCLKKCGLVQAVRASSTVKKPSAPGTTPAPGTNPLPGTTMAKAATSRSGATALVVGGLIVAALIAAGAAA